MFKPWNSYRNSLLFALPCRCVSPLQLYPLSDSRNCPLTEQPFSLMTNASVVTPPPYINLYMYALFLSNVSSVYSLINQLLYMLLNLDDLCTVSRPAITLLTVVKEIKNPKLKMSILACLEKVGICCCVSPDILVTTLLNK